MMTNGGNSPSQPFTLSAEQLAVIDHRGGHLQVIACAGSGKTESVARRIAGLIAEGEPPESIIAFTFTERAAAELKERIYSRVEEVMGREFLGRLGPMFVGTIHGYCFHLLQDYVPRFGNFDVLDPHRHAGLLSREFRRLGLDRLGSGHWASIAGFAQTVDVISNELIRPEQLDGTDLGACYRDYLATLDRYHYLTFGQIIAQAIEALGDPAIYERVHGPLRHLIVDEYQDINPAQERLIELLGASPVHVCVVGDDDQSIYQWRGSDVMNMLSFAARWPTVTSRVLATNRRSRPRILTAANGFARSIVPRLSKAMKEFRPAARVELVTWAAETPSAEAEQIAETIAMLRAKGFRHRDIAVLYRSVRTSAPPLIDALRARGIAFVCGGRTGLFLQPEVAVLAQTYIWFVDNDWRDSPWDEPHQVTLDRLVDGYGRTFGGTRALPDLRRILGDWKKLTRETNRPVSLVDDLYRFYRLLGVHELDLDQPDGAARVGGLARFSRILADFENVTRRGRYVEEEGQRQFRGGTDRGIEYYRRLANFIQHYARDAYEDFEGESFADLDAVDIMTVHQAKGLEWPVVFIPALVQRRFPSGLAGKAQDWLLPESVFPPAARARYEGGDAEEKRLFYVALTRARDCAYLSCFERITKASRPSPYLTDVAKGAIPAMRALPLPDPPERGESAEEPPIEMAFWELAQYEECPHQYRLANSLGFQIPLVTELGYGRAVHHVLRQVAETSRRSGRVPTVNEALGVLDQEFYLPFANRANFAAMYGAATRLVRRYVEEYAEDFSRIWAIERPFELHTDGGLLTGRADVILDRHEGRPDSLAIVDYKTATGAEQEPLFAFQLAVYAAAGRGEGLSVDAAFLHELSDGRRHSIDISSPRTAAAATRVAAAVGRVRAAEFPPRPERRRCTHCDYKRVCRHAECNPVDLL